MPLTIIIPEAVINDSVVIAITDTFQRVDATNVYHPLGTKYTFSPEYEMKFTQAAYDLLNSKGCVMNGGTFYVKTTDKKVSADVALTFNDRIISKEDSPDNKETTRAWKDYSIEEKKLASGEYRLRCLHFPVGSTISQNGLTDEERKLWHQEFDGLLVKAEGMALKLEEDIKVDEFIK